MRYEGSHIETETSDNQTSDNQMSDNQMSDNQMKAVLPVAIIFIKRGQRPPQRKLSSMEEGGAERRMMGRECEMGL